MLEEIVLPPSWEVVLDQYQLAESGITLQAHLASLQSLCPCCDQPSGRVNQAYFERLAT